MANIKSTEAIAEKFSRVTPSRQQDYVDGVESPRTDWATATAAAEANYQTGVQAAIASKKFGKGVKRAGTAKWQLATKTKGPGRWAEGVSNAAASYETGFRPYAETIKSLQLPARGPVGSPQNLQRVAAVANALHEKKQQLTGGK
jgi:hypothetical protein